VNVHPFCGNHGKSDTKTLALIIQALQEESMNRTWLLEWESSNSPKKARQVKSKVKSKLIICCDIKGTVQEELVLTDKTVSSAYCCGVFRQLHENVRRLRSELWRQHNWLLHDDNALFFTSEFFY
jgi:hypothetical protein